MPRSRHLLWMIVILLPLIVAGLSLPAGRQASAAPRGASAPTLALLPFASGFAEPTDIASAGDERLFVAEREGTIRIVAADGTVLSHPFLDLTERVGSDEPEQGLLGLVFHPNFAENGYFYVNYTDTDITTPGDTIVSRFQVSGADPNHADPDSEQVVLTVEQPFGNHNGGDMAFGPDGYLTLALGDGGSSGDPLNNAQSLDTLLGKLLRIDVDVADGVGYEIPADNPFVGQAGARGEIWALGLRNPWRFSFDRATGDLYVGDVGQGAWEEIDYVEAGVGGANFGWRCYEGNHGYNTSGCLPMEQYTAPIFEYDHSQGRSVTGGFVYRGSRYPQLYGLYIFADFVEGTVWSLSNAGGTWEIADTLEESGENLSTFGEDAAGELYVASFGGTLYRVTDNSPQLFLPFVATAPEPAGR